MNILYIDSLYSSLLQSKTKPLGFLLVFFNTGWELCLNFCRTVQHPTSKSCHLYHYENSCSAAPTLQFASFSAALSACLAEEMGLQLHLQL